MRSVLRWKQLHMAGMVVPGTLGFFILLLSCTIMPAQSPAPALVITHTLEGHKELVCSVSFTPDGKHLISGSFDKTLKVWEVATGKEVKTLGGPLGHQDIILGTSIRSDGQVFASNAKDNTIKLWDMPTGGMIRDFSGHSEKVTCSALTAAGSKLVTGCADGSFRIWNNADGKTLVSGKASAAITSIAIAPDGQSLATSQTDGTISVWSMADGKQLGSIGAQVGPANVLAFHPKLPVLYSGGGAEGLLKTWTLPLTAPTAVEVPNKPALTVGAISPDGARWAIAGADKLIRLINATSGVQEKLMPAAPAEITCVATVSNFIVAGLSDGRVVSWDSNANVVLHVHELAKGKRVMSISLRADSGEYAAALDDGTIKIVELTKVKDRPFEEVYSKRLPANPAGLTCVAYHPTDPNIVATGGIAKAIKLWKVKEGTEVINIAVKNPISALTWSRDGARLAAAVDNSVAIHQVSDGKLLHELSHPTKVKSFTFSPDAQRVVSLTDAGLVILWDSVAGKEMQSYRAAALVGAALIPDGKKVLLLAGSNAILEPVALNKTIPVLAKPIRAMTFFDSGNRMIVGGDDGIARVVELAGGKVERELKGHTASINSVTVSPNNLLAFTSAGDKTIRAFSLADGKELKAIPQPADVTSLAMHPGGQIILAGRLDKTALTLNVLYAAGQPLSESFGKEVQTFVHAEAVQSVTIHPAGNMAFTASADKTAKVWRMISDGPTKNLAGHTALVYAAHFSPDGQTIASCSHDGTLRLWNPGDGKQLVEVKLTPQPQPFYCVAWRPDGKQLAVGGMDRIIRFVDVATKKVEREIKGHDEKNSPLGHKDAVYSVAYTPNGQQLYSTGADGQIKLWNVADGAHLKVFIDPALKEKAQRDWVNQMRLTLDGNRLVAVGSGGWITVWNTADGKLIHSQKMPTGLYGISISPDNKLIATGNQNGMIYLIKMP